MRNTLTKQIEDQVNSDREEMLINSQFTLHYLLQRLGDTVISHTDDDDYYTIDFQLSTGEVATLYARGTYGSWGCKI
jgi:hypothetical protein